MYCTKRFAFCAILRAFCVLCGHIPHIIMPEIWDVHCHLANPLTGRTAEARLGRLLEIADRMGISRLCVYMGMKWSYDPTPADFRQQNDDVLAAIHRFPD